MDKLICLPETANIFPVVSVGKRKWHKDFFWDYFVPTGRARSKADKDKEEGAWTDVERKLHSVLCKLSEERGDYTEFDYPSDVDDDDLASRASSCV